MAKPVPQFDYIHNELILRRIKFTIIKNEEGRPSHFEKVPLLFWEFVYIFSQISYKKQPKSVF